MAKKNQNKSSPKNKKKTPLLIPIFLGALIIITLCGLLYFMVLRPGTIAPPIHKKPVVQKKIKKEPVITKSIPQPTQKAEPVIIPDKKEQPPAVNKPRLALIIDDIGFTKKYADKIIDLDLNLTFSILPSGPHAKNLSQKIFQKNREILLHQPMEATDKKWALGPNGMLLSMSKSQLIRTLNSSIKAVPLAVGLNNHMGSKFTQDPAAMRVVLDVTRSHNLFFVDSLTTAKTVGYRLAKDMGIKTIKRNVFLDNIQDKEKIIEQLKKLVKLATKRGQAVGIGHPYVTTYDALESFQEKLREEVTLVKVSELVE